MSDAASPGLTAPRRGLEILWSTAIYALTAFFVINVAGVIATVVVNAVETVPFIEVPWHFAQAEGEGDESLDEWREGHRRFWTSEGDTVDDQTPVVLMWFEVVSN